MGEILHKKSNACYPKGFKSIMPYWEHEIFMFFWKFYLDNFKWHHFVTQTKSGPRITFIFLYSKRGRLPQVIKFHSLPQLKKKKKKKPNSWSHTERVKTKNETQVQTSDLSINHSHFFPYLQGPLIDLKKRKWELLEIPTLKLCFYTFM